MASQINGPELNILRMCDEGKQLPHGAATNAILEYLWGNGYVHNRTTTITDKGRETLIEYGLK